MEFCPECGTLLLPKDGLLRCRCGYTKEIGDDIEEKYNLSENPEDAREITIIEEEIQQMPTCKAECRKCGNLVAYYWMLQTRGADEPATKFFRCTKCKHTWREYD